VSNAGHPLPERVLEALRSGRPIEAVKLLRESGGLGLREAVEAIDAQRRKKAPPPSFAASAPPPPPSSAKKLVETSRLSPGEMPRTGGLAWWVAAAGSAWLAYRAFFPRLE